MPSLWFARNHAAGLPLDGACTSAHVFLRTLTRISHSRTHIHLSERTTTQEGIDLRSQLHSCQVGIAAGKPQPHLLRKISVKMAWGLFRFGKHSSQRAEAQLVWGHAVVWHSISQHSCAGVTGAWVGMGSCVEPWSLFKVPAIWAKPNSNPYLFERGCLRLRPRLGQARTLQRRLLAGDSGVQPAPRPIHP